MVTKVRMLLHKVKMCLSAPKLWRIFVKCFGESVYTNTFWDHYTLT